MLKDVVIVHDPGLEIEYSDFEEPSSALEVRLRWLQKIWEVVFGTDEGANGSDRNGESGGYRYAYGRSLKGKERAYRLSF